ncbi:MAG: hypothetical protein KAS19_09095 [Anaerolineales bacterium]|nr:hypothetical protein [Anaerolineales bacterium]
MAKASWSYRDASDEMSSVEVTIADVSAGGADFDAVMADVAAIGAALLTATECIQAREFFNQAVDVKNPATPTDPQAHRESALRIFYGDDTTGEVYHISLPGPDWDNIDMEPNTDLADLTDEPVASLVSALEAGGLSPVGNAITVLRAVRVGRHN